MMGMKMLKEETGLKKMLNFIIIVFLSSLILSGNLKTADASASQSIDPIAVDLDPYYQGIDGNAAYSMIQKETQKASGELTRAVQSTYGSRSAPVAGDVRLLFAEGYRYFTLKAIGDYAEIWVANDLSYCPGDPRPEPVVTQEQVDYLFNEFNKVIYPNNTKNFGYTKDRNGSSGIFAKMGLTWYLTDNPQRVMVLVFNIVDEGYCDPDYPFYTAGYFWPFMSEVAADRNIIHIDPRDWENRIGKNAKYPNLYEQVFAHEYEHAIHFDHDPDESAWVNEGMADLAPFLAGYGHSRRHLEYYMIYHRTPLLFWGGGLEDYGKSYLFQLYLLENFGGPAFIKALVDEQENGIEGINKTLSAFGYSTTFDDVYRDWTIANYLDSPSLTGISGGKLGYESLDIPSVDTSGYSIQWSIKNNYGSYYAGNYPLPRHSGGYKSGVAHWPFGSIPPYAPVYLTYKDFSPLLVSNFKGINETGIPAFSGKYEIWGGRGDLLFNTATLTSTVTLDSNAKLNFMTRYDIENTWDFGFVQISTDRGATWRSLSNQNTTSNYNPQAHPDVIANVPGFTGTSSVWNKESFDLSEYKGENVTLRFLYITDWAGTGDGFFVDDIIVSDDRGERLRDDLESGSVKWNLSGWEYTTGMTANDWMVSFINPEYKNGKFSKFSIEDGNMKISGKYQKAFTSLDTEKLNQDSVTIILSNRLPEDRIFPSRYALLVKKGSGGI